MAAYGQWTPRPSFSDVISHCEYDGGTLCVCRNGVFVVDRSGEITTLAKSTGLSSSYVSAGAASGSVIAVGYEDGSLDIISGGHRTTLPDITLGKPHAISCIRHITFSNSLILASGDFGVSVVDSYRGEVLASCPLPGVEMCLVANDEIFALTAHGAYSAAISCPNLQDPGQWSYDGLYQLMAEKTAYGGPVPRSVPCDYAHRMAQASGVLSMASRYYTEVQRSGIFYTENPDGVDFTAVFHNPYNPQHVFLGDENGTVFEYIGHNLKARYAGRARGRIVDMDCTPEGDLLILSADRANPVTIFDHNGNWHSASSFQSMNCASPLGLLRMSDYVFLVNMGQAGIFAVDLGGTPLDFSDDRHVSFYPMVGGAKAGGMVTCMAMDMHGMLLLGTDRGVVACARTERIMEGTAVFANPVVVEPLGTSDQYAQHLLHGKHITAIDIDAANRKWISTMGAGVFLVSADTDKEIARYNERNSPLPSDTVYSLRIVQQTGDVFFSTRNGLASYMSDVQEPSADMNNVLVYPNPVRPDYNGDISVSGLEDGSSVRIADAAGHLVFSCVSEGGRISWDGRNLRGHKCATGVYLIFVVNPDTGHKIAKKLLIVR